MPANKIHPFVRLAWRIDLARGRTHVVYPQWLREGLFHARPLLGNLWGWIAQTLLHEPALRARCRQVGAGLRLYGAPRIMGNGIIDIGREVEIAPELSLLIGLGMPEPPVLQIGDYAHVGPQNIFCIVRGLTIGTHVRTGPGVCIYDNDMHPMDPVRRREQTETMPLTKSAPIVIEDDVWIGLHALVLKGVHIGRGAVVAAGAVVTESVPSGSVVAGNPARVVGQIDAAAAPPRG